jgi:oligosaccharyltransferase complex subunit gamma
MISLLSSIALVPLFLSSALGATNSRFEDLRTKAFPISLDDTKFAAITSAPRDYANVVLLTAMDSRFKCAACHQIAPEWESIAKVWQRNDKGGASRTIFTQVDFNDGRDTFQKLELQHAPVIYLFPPTVGPSAKPNGQPVRFDFTGGASAEGSVTAEAIHQWLSRQLSENEIPKYVKPFNYLKFGIFGIVSVGFVTALVAAAPYLAPVIQNRNVWAAVSLLAVLLFTSGHMFNQIRKVPYVAGDGKGGVSYFAGGFQNQFGMETQIIACLCKYSLCLSL